MKPTTPDRIRNVALISHGGAGKTSLAEAMLFDAGAIQRLGSVDAGTATLDHDPDEQKRKQSINLAIGHARARRRADHGRRHPRLRRLREPTSSRRSPRSTPRSWSSTRARASRSAPRRCWRMADERRMPRFVFVNKMDRENANYDAVLDALKAAFGPKIAPVYLPIGAAESFRGYVDVIEEHATVYENGKPSEVPIPAELEGIEHSRRDALVEAAAEASDELMEKYLEGEPFTDAEIEARRPQGDARGIGGAGVRRQRDEEHRRPRAAQHDRQAHPVAGRDRRPA